MAKKKGKQNPENYFNNISDWRTEAEPRAVTPEGVPVFCAYDELAPIGKCVPNPGNPNTHPPKQIALLAAIIKGQGWRKPITISRRSGLLWLAMADWKPHSSWVQAWFRWSTNNTPRKQRNMPT